LLINWPYRRIYAGCPKK